MEHQPWWKTEHEWPTACTVPGGRQARRMACGTWQGWEVLRSEVATSAAAGSCQVVARPCEVRLPCSFCSHVETLFRHATSHQLTALTSLLERFLMSCNGVWESPSKAFGCAPSSLACTADKLVGFRRHTCGGRARLQVLGRG